MGELGSLLTRAREARGLTLEDAERDTRISRRYLQALESEQFEVIPAPVYARGFLRSYSQYLGLDPQETLALFPREDDPEYQRAGDATTPTPRPSPDRPVSPVSASRPTWRSSPPASSGQQGPRPFPGQGAGQPHRPEPVRRPEPNQPYEPVIGVDIGVPTPTRRIKTDPAAQTRSVVIAVVAIAAVLGVILLAYIISSLGGDDTAPGGDAEGTSASRTSTAAAGSTPASNGNKPSGLDVTPGIVPDLQGAQQDVALRAIAEAGYVPRELREKASAPKGTVINQSPVAGAELAAGSTVQIVVSEGP